MNAAGPLTSSVMFFATSARAPEPEAPLASSDPACRRPGGSRGGDAARGRRESWSMRVIAPDRPPCRWKRRPAPSQPWSDRRDLFVVDQHLADLIARRDRGDVELEHAEAEAGDGSTSTFEEERSTLGVRSARSDGGRQRDGEILKLSTPVAELAPAFKSASVNRARAASETRESAAAARPERAG